MPESSSRTRYCEWQLRPEPRALGLSSVCGTIEVGKRADLILVDLQTSHVQPINDVFSQIVHCAKASDVQTVIVSGEILMRDRQLIRHEEKKLLADARQANGDLMERMRMLTF